VKAESLESVRGRLRASVSVEAVKALERRAEAYERGELLPRPRHGVRFPRGTISNFQDKLRRDENGCLLWTASITERGHGRFNVGGEVVRAHRFAWEMANGPVPDGFQVRQTCGVKSCVEVTHLELVEEPRRRKPADLFWEKTRPDEESGCLLWTATMSSDGYGAFHLKGKQIRAHRFAWELKYGSIPEGYVVHHRCNNRVCVNVKHLELMKTVEHNRLSGSGPKRRLGPSLGQSASPKAAPGRF